MCNRYTPPHLLDMEREWHIGNRNPIRWWDPVLYPRGQGPFLRRAKDDAAYSRELVVGQWGLIPWFAKEPKLKYPTNNARSEEVQDKASYKGLKQWLETDVGQIPEDWRKRLDEMLARSQNLATFYAMREELTAVWNRTNASREQLIADLQAWCQKAEASGIRQLQDMSVRMRSYALA